MIRGFGFVYPMRTQSGWSRVSQTFLFKGNSIRGFLALLLVSLFVTGCDNPQRTVDELKSDIAAYRAKATDDGKLRIQSGFEKLDQQILKLNEKGETLKADLLQQQRDELATQFTAAQLGRVVNDAAEALKGFGKAFERAGKEIQGAIQNGKEAATNAP